MRPRRTSFHWGVFDVEQLQDGKVTLEPSAGMAGAEFGRGIASTLGAPYRIVEPMVRRGWLDESPDGRGRSRDGRGSEPFVAVSWEDALNLAARELTRVSEQHGNEQIYGGSYGWGSAGRFHHAQSQIHRFLAGLGGYTSSVGSYSLGAMEAILPRVIGGAPWSLWERGPTWPAIASDGELVVCFGGMAPKNAQANSGGLSTSEQVEGQLNAHGKGVRFVSVSPNPHDMHPDLNAQWIYIRPNTDVALMLGLAFIFETEGLADRGFLKNCCVGYEQFRRYLVGETDGVPKSPTWAHEVSGVPVHITRNLAREIAASRTTINVSWSIQRQDHGEQPYWMAVTLAAMSGSMGLRGGGLAAGLGISNTGVRRKRWTVAALPPGTNAVKSRVPVARISDALLNPGQSYKFNGGNYKYPLLRLIYWAGGNPFHHHQDLHRLVRAWRRPDTVIVHEAWWNPLARHADIVFPVATPLERRDLSIGGADCVLIASDCAMPPPTGVRTDYDVFAALATRLGFGHGFTLDRTADEWVDALYEETRAMLAAQGVIAPPLDEFLRAGVFRMPEFTGPIAGDFELLRKDPERHPLDTPSGKIEIFSEAIDAFGYSDCPGHPTWLEPAEWLGGATAEKFPIHLLSNQPSTRLHSQHDGGDASQASKVRDREPVLISDEDAAQRGISDGDVVKLFNDRGACLAGARVDPALRSGVAVLSTGAWFDPETPGVSGTLCRHGNPNVLTRDAGTSALAQGPASGTTLIEIVRFDEPLPPMRAFVPPPIERR